MELLGRRRQQSALRRLHNRLANLDRSSTELLRLAVNLCCCGLDGPAVALRNAWQALTGGCARREGCPLPRSAAAATGLRHQGIEPRELLSGVPACPLIRSTDTCPAGQARGGGHIRRMRPCEQAADGSFDPRMRGSLAFGHCLPAGAVLA